MKISANLRCSALILMVALVPGSAARVQAQDDPPAKAAPAKKADPKAAAPQGDVLKQWQELSARRDQIMKTVEKLQKDAQKADEAGRNEIRAAFEKIRKEMMEDVGPRMQALLPEVYKKDPLNVEVAEPYAFGMLQENKFQDVIAITDKLIEAKKSNGPILNFAGIAHFAVHDFGVANQLLTQAQKADPEVFQSLGAPFLAASAEYPGFWKEEQAIRAAEAKADDLPRVLIKTSKGDILIELFENEAPNTVANFISLVEAKFYDGTRFHRVIPNFMTQGGDPNTLDKDPSNDGQGGPGYQIACECYSPKARRHFQGSLSMAHAGKDTGGSQFFLTHLPTPHLNANPAEQRGHTVFGRILKGIEVNNSLRPGDQLISATVVRKRNHAYKPKTTADARPAPGKKPAKQ